ncbi:MAG: sensor histidine kinase [Candidatus Pseudobacter hemicellulosilyticus]|uniref:histidine kinase n=1 Tax=Candidatus Pseudobacter hemicellulosilyticus TaxID=3121375 RepID=A0AAJ5WX59_9BACT|nr:MAG: sensor histidine kinase [Pseudobacter sp.]
MPRATLLLLLCSLLLSVGGRSQPTAQAGISAYSYYPPERDKESWQRLNLWLSATYLYVSKEAMEDQDSCLLLASRSLGLSRFSILAEGFGDEKLRHQSSWINQGAPGTGMQLLSGTTGKKQLQVLLLLGAYYAFQPGSYSRYKDSVEYFVHKAIAASRELQEQRWERIALCLLEKVYLQGADRNADSLCASLLDQCRKAGDKETEARAIAYRGIFTIPGQANFNRKLADLQQAADSYQRLGDTEGAINVWTDLGYIFSATGQDKQAYEAFTKALLLEEAIGFPYTQYSTDNLAMITFFQGKFGEPLRYTRQTIKVAESCRDSIGWAYYYSRLANLYISENRDKEGVEMVQKATRQFITDRNPALYNILQIEISYLNAAGRAREALDQVTAISQKVSPVIVSDLFYYHHILSGCYINLNRFDSAEFHIRKMDSLENITEAVRGPFRRGSVNNQLAALYLKRGQYHKAKEFLENHFRISSYGHRSLRNDLNIYSMLITADSALGDQAAVIAHYKEYIKLIDSNFKATKIRQAEELQVVYETQEKEKQITVLNQQAKQTRTVTNVTLAGIAAVIIIAILLYRQNRLKQRSNTIITQKNGQLQDLLADKEWLLKEVHHRVKNNLQIIMSLLNSQSRYIDNEEALMAINDSQRRVQAISLIHQKLYQSDNTYSIDMRQYIDELISYAQDGFDTGSRAVIEQDIEPVRLDVSKAIPLGLIINEGIVNAMKYAFPGQHKGIVRISLKHTATEQLLLSITDNGIGLPPDAEITGNSSLGFNLMRGLARQLDGTFTIESNQGLHITIRFSPLTNPSYEL